MTTIAATAAAIAASRSLGYADVSRLGISPKYWALTRVNKTWQNIGSITSGIDTPAS
jgi:hypothetical protein